MTDVSVTAKVTGFEEGAKKVEGLNKSLDQTTDSAKKVTTATAGTTDSVKKLTESLTPAQQAFQHKFGMAANEATAAVSKFSSVAQTAAGVIGGGLAIALGAGVMKLVEATTAAVKYGDRLSELSQSTGVAVETLSGMRIAAESNNLSMDSLAHSLERFNRVTAETQKKTKDGTDAFGRMGISLKDSNGTLKTTETLLGEVADKFQSYKNGADKTALAMELFGRSGAGMIAFLNQGSKGLAQMQEEARKAGIVMSSETAEAADKLSENLAVLKSYAQGFWQEVASPIVEALRRVTDAMREARAEGGWMMAMFAGLGRAAQEVLGIATPNQERDNAIIQMTRRQKMLADARARGDVPQQRALEAEIAYFQAERDRHNAVIGIKQGTAAGSTALGEFGTTPVGLGNAPPPVAKPDKKGRAGRGDPYWDEVVANAKEADKELEKLRKEQEAAENEYYSNIVRFGKAAADELAKIDKERKETEKKELTQLQEVNNRAAQAELRNINATTFLFKEHKMAALEELRLKYLAMGEAGEKALARVTGEMEALEDATRDAGVVVQDVGFDMNAMWKTVHTGLTNYLGQIGRWAVGLESNIKGIGDAVKGFFKSIVASIIDMLAQLAANQIFRWIFGGEGKPGAAGGILGGIGSLFSGGANAGSGGGGGILSSIGDFLGFGSGGGGGGIFTPGGGIGGGGFPSPGSFMNFGGALDFIGGLGTGLFNSAGTTAALIESGTVGFAGAGLEAASGLSGVFSGIGTALPWIGGALAIGSVLGLFDDGGGPKEQTVWWRYGGGNNLGIGDENITSQDPNYYAAAAEVTRQLHAKYGAAALSTVPTMSVSGAAGSDPYALLSQITSRIVGTLTQNGFAMGTDMLVSKPTMFMAGEAGTERVTVSPVGAAHGGLRGGGGVTVVVNGLSMLDGYSAKRMATELRRMVNA